MPDFTSPSGSVSEARAKDVGRARADRLEPADQIQNATYIYDHLSNLGEKSWSIEAICGLLGNIQAESWFNPGVWQRYDEKGGHSIGGRGGYGLVQWTNFNEKFLPWAKEKREKAGTQKKTPLFISAGS